MLTRHSAAWLAVLVLLAGLMTALSATPAAAACRTVTQTDEWGKTVTTVICDDSTTTPISNSDGNGGGGTAVCRNQAGTEIPCSVDGAWWSTARNCYITTADIPLDSPAWGLAGVEPGEGAFYSCNSSPRLVDGSIPLVAIFWLPAPPPPPPNPVDLAREALSRITMRPGTIGITPPPGPDSKTLLGPPTWLWVADADAQTVGPTQSASASDQGLTVTVTAQMSRISFDMGRRDHRQLLRRRTGPPPLLRGLGPAVRALLHRPVAGPARRRLHRHRAHPLGHHLGRGRPDRHAARCHRDQPGHHRPGRRGPRRHHREEPAPCCR